jgi:branched-chain amino acid transport system substrate-binding protein
MLRKRYLVFLLVTLLSALFLGIVSAQDDEPIVIGLLTDQSGALTVYGYELEYGVKLGLLYQAGIDPSDYDTIDDALADVRIAGRPVEILVRDNGSDPDTGASQARELIEVDGAEVLIGAPSSGVTVGLQQVALDNDVMLFVAPGASPAITGANFNVNTVRVCRSAIQDTLAWTKALDDLGTNWIILAADYEFGRATAAGYEALLPAEGVTFVHDTIYAPLETTDFTAYLQEVLASDADVLLPIWAGDTTVALLQQIAELGVLDQMSVALAGNSNDIIVASDPTQVGITMFLIYHYTFPDTEINDWMTEKHVEFFPNPFTGETDFPDLFTECAFATAQAVVLALEATGGDTLPEAMIPAVEGLIFDGPKGTYGIRPSDHQALAPLYIAQLANLDSPEFAFYDLVAEIPAVEVAPPCQLPEDMQDRCDMDADFMEAFTEASMSE